MLTERKSSSSLIAVILMGALVAFASPAMAKGPGAPGNKPTGTTTTTKRKKTTRNESRRTGPEGGPLSVWIGVCRTGAY